ncbi:tRNA (adenosine(37)-N6)-threonylcarbamoyltransferase complex ATPase subunit type 1 TsaE [Pelagibacteraceae bacterium]|jgi:tRNA threonylcarbamoyladenosine biosynthesis protein TsaE|nr:tRNA (adenosine(37)-N6)-threonylcarbamoyltransferase complex ATPase subunit type 1 TsaE [Pelagibacteraceae bacterium]
MIIKSLDHLQLISKKIADKITEKDCIFLIGEIGVGKTTFTRSLINYFQKREGVEQTEVLSPTFNLLYEYDIKKIKVMHYDLYRVKNSKELNQLGIFNENIKSIKIIEWPQLIETNITDKLELHLSYASNENERILILKGLGKWKEFNLNEL